MSDVLDELRAAGLTFIYSTALVPASLRIEEESRAPGGLELAREILQHHGLGLSQAAPGVYAVIADPAAANRDLAQDASPPLPVIEESPLQEVVVETSRYSLAADPIAGKTFLAQEQVKNMPLLADETLRAVQRLPGSATNGFSSLSSIRGGEPNETAIVLDGLRLYEPFHLKNFLSPVSLLDSRLIKGIEFFSGGFPVVYGARMSAIIDASSIRPELPQYYELGLNLLHASALASTEFAAGRAHLLLSARRSNAADLAHYAEHDFGEPNYSDGFARASYRLNDDTDVTFEVLTSRDSIRARRASGAQQATAEYRNIYVWGTLDHAWSQRAASRLIASYTDLANERGAHVDEPEARLGAVRDERTFHVLGLRLENTLEAEVLTQRFGLEVRRLWGRYDYASSLRFEENFPFPGSPAFERERRLAPTPAGFETSAYWDARASITDRWILYGGMRIDTQTYDSADEGEQWSPRLAVLYSLTPRTQARVSLGRFFQSQGINELQVEDGLEHFHPAQYADHAIFSLEHQFPTGFDLRIEAYVKDYRRVNPRFENLFDPLALFPEAEFDRVRVAPDDARASGVEVVLGMQPHGSWSGWFSYAWSRVEDRVAGQRVPRSWDQPHTVNLGVVWARGPWNVTLTNTYHSGWPTTALKVVNDNGVPQVVTTLRNRDRFDFYNSLDFRVTRTYLMPRGVLDVFVEASNTLDRENPCCLKYTLTEDALNARKIDTWLPLVPSLGVLWRYGAERTRR